VRRTSVHALHFSANLNHPRASPERITLLTGASTHSRYSSISSNALIFASLILKISPHQPRRCLVHFCPTSNTMVRISIILAKVQLYQRHPSIIEQISPKTRTRHRHLETLSLEYPIDADMHGISPTPSIPMADASHLYMHLLLPISKAAVYFFPGMGSVAFGGGERFSI
jgi:hypothetical protein